MDQRKCAFRSGIQIKLDANERRKLVYEIELNPLLRSTLDNAYFGCRFSVPRVLWHPAGIDLKLDCFQAGLFQLFDAMLDWLTHVASISRGYIYLYLRLRKIYIYIYIYIYMKCNYLIEWHKLLQIRTVRGAPISFNFFLARRGNNSFAALQGHLKILIWDPKILAGLNKIYLIPPKAL